MDPPRPRAKKVFTGFTKAEILKMEKLLNEVGEKALSKEICQDIAKSFSRSSARAGKPIVKWTGVHSWFESRKEDSAKGSKNLPDISGASPPIKAVESSETLKDEKIPDLTELEFEARSSKDGAWYDVDVFLAHRWLSSGESEVRVRYVGFGSEEDEWINIKKAIRERSVPIEHSECHKVKVGDLVLCFQERRDRASYYDAHVLDIHRRMHDIRGCRCVFLVRYDHDDNEIELAEEIGILDVHLNCSRHIGLQQLASLPSADDYIRCRYIGRLFLLDCMKDMSKRAAYIKLFREMVDV